MLPRMYLTRIFPASRPLVMLSVEGTPSIRIGWAGLFPLLSATGRTRNTLDERPPSSRPFSENPRIIGGLHRNRVAHPDPLICC